MRKFSATIWILCIGAASLSALTLPAEVDGLKVWVMEYQLKMAGSKQMAQATVDLELDLTGGVGDSLSNPLAFEEVNQEANELSITFDNSYVYVKAYAYDEGSLTYYYTSAAGVQTSTDGPALWTDYNYQNLGEIYPGGDVRYVVQSYFPEPVLIEANSSHLIGGKVNLEFSVFFYDGIGIPTGNASWTGAVFTQGTKGFAVSELDAVLAMDKDVSSEVYLFANTAGALTPSTDDFTSYRAMALYFDADGNLHDGAAKNGTGYGVQSGSAVVGAWKRLSGAAPAADGSIPFTVAVNFDSSTQSYYYEHVTSGFKRLSDVQMSSATVGTFTATVAGTDYTVYYRRMK